MYGIYIERYLTVYMHIHGFILLNAYTRAAFKTTCTLKNDLFQVVNRRELFFAASREQCCVALCEQYYQQCCSAMITMLS